MGFGPIPWNAPKGQRLRLLALVGVLALTPLLFLGGPDWIARLLNTSAWNLGHIALFALLTLALHPWRRIQGWRLWLVATVSVLVIGLLIEMAQSRLGREADWRDIWRNFVGVWLILGWQPFFASPPKKSPTIAAMAAASTLLLMAELGTTGVAAVRQYQLDHLLPELYDFEHTDPAPFWHGRLGSAPHHDGNHGQSLRIELGTELYSGASLNRLPTDWRSFDELNLSLFNPDQQPLPLTLRINDLEHELGGNAYGDRFNTSFTLAPGLNRLSFRLEDIEQAPEHRPMDMSKISRLTLFAIRLPEPRTLYLLDLRLN